MVRFAPRPAKQCRRRKSRALVVPPCAGTHIPDSRPGRRRWSVGCQTSSQAQLRHLAAQCARVLIEFCPSQSRGSRESRMRAAPAVSCAKMCERNAHEHTGSAEAIRHSLRNGFTAYAVISPATNSFLSPSSADMDCLSPVGPTRLRRLSTSNGCQNHTVLPYAAPVFAKRLRRALRRSSARR
jgi:hypothetical protein